MNLDTLKLLVSCKTTKLSTIKYLASWLLFKILINQADKFLQRKKGYKGTSK